MCLARPGQETAKAGLGRTGNLLEYWAQGSGCFAGTLPLSPVTLAFKSCPLRGQTQSDKSGPVGGSRMSAAQQLSGRTCLEGSGDSDHLWSCCSVSGPSGTLSVGWAPSRFADEEAGAQRGTVTPEAPSLPPGHMGYSSSCIPSRFTGNQNALE